VYCTNCLILLMYMVYHMAVTLTAVMARWVAIDRVWLTSCISIVSIADLVEGRRREREREDRGYEELS
jgi:hypothetical protein